MESILESKEKMKYKYALYESWFNYKVIMSRVDEMKRYKMIYSTGFSKMNYLRSFFRDEQHHKLVETPDHYDLTLYNEELGSKIGVHFFIDKETGYMKINDKIDVYEVGNPDHFLQMTLHELTKKMFLEDKEEAASRGMTFEEFEKMDREEYKKRWEQKRKEYREQLDAEYAQKDEMEL